MEMEEQTYNYIQQSPVPTGKVKTATAMLFLSAMIFFTFGGSLVSIGLYVQLDHGFVSDIIGSALYQAAAYAALVSGFLIFCLGLVGVAAALSKRRWQLIVYLTALLILALVVLICALLALIFRASLIDATKAAMRNSLRIQYGKTRLVTEAWDLTQEKLRCCAVDNNGWSAYLSSEWDIMVNADARNLQQRLPEWSPLYLFVPASCCLKLIDPRTLWPSGRYKDLAQCLYWPYGPPNHANGGFNDALYYRGCYHAGAEFLSSHGRFFASIGFMLFIAMIVGIVSALTVLSTGADPEAAKIRRDAKEAYMKPEPLLLSSAGGGEQTF